VYSFLSVAWGIIADIDLESEKIRCCGDSRYTIWGAYRALSLRKYPATVFY
jgi:sphingosine kinase